MKNVIGFGIGFALLLAVLNRSESDNLSNEFTDNIVNPIKSALGLWRAPDKYAGAIESAENAYSIPTGVLERLLFQESHYREDIINGIVKSRVGAVGIAQFMPATARDFGINPLDPFQSIDAAGKYLGQLFNRFGNWSEALAAYNWGMGNVQRKGLQNAPAETVAYYSNILGDVNSEFGTQLA